MRTLPDFAAHRNGHSLVPAALLPSVPPHAEAPCSVNGYFKVEGYADRFQATGRGATASEAAAASRPPSPRRDWPWKPRRQHLPCPSRGASRRPADLWIKESHRAGQLGPDRAPQQSGRPGAEWCRDAWGARGPAHSGLQYAGLNVV